MQIKVYVIDFELPRWTRRALVYAAIPAAVVLGTTALVHADVQIPQYGLNDPLTHDGLNSRFNTLADAINKSQMPVGTIVASMLDLGQFQGQMGLGWLLADGSPSGAHAYSTYAPNLPDLRGVTLRGKNYTRDTGSGNPDGDVAVGTLQADMLGSHSHSLPINPAHSGTVGGEACWTSGTHEGDLALPQAGGNETRMRNVTVNYFIRVD